MLSGYGTLCMVESAWSVFASHMSTPYMRTVFPKGKEAFEYKFYSVLSPQNADYSGVLFLYLAEDLTANHHSYLFRKSSLNY